MTCQSDSRDRGALTVGRCFSQPQERQKNAWVRLRLSLSAIPSGVLRKNHTSAIRHLAGPIRDVGPADPRESAFADLRRYGFGEP
jgi:hypothetical protein